MIYYSVIILVIIHCIVLGVCLMFQDLTLLDLQVVVIILTHASFGFIFKWHWFCLNPEPENCSRVNSIDVVCINITSEMLMEF
jgi:hypothetical protein